MRKTALLILTLIVPLLLFTYTAYNSYGFDDEYFNIAEVIEKYNYSSAYELIKDHLSGRFIDIHPVGSFLINYLLIKALGSWNLVRVAGALLVCVSMWLYWLRISTDWGGGITKLFSYIIICLNPTVLLWGTSLRWYTYCLPIVCIIGFLLYSPNFLKQRKYLFWGLYFFTVSIMFYIETNTAIMILVSFVMLLIQRRKSFHDEWKTILCFGLLAVLFVSRQIYLFLTVLYPAVSGSSEFLPLIRTIAGGGQNFLCGHAVIPVSAAGIALIIANTLLFIVFLLNIKAVASNYSHGFYMLSYVSYILVGIGGKVRNYTPLYPVQGTFLTDIFSRIKSSKLKITILVLYIFGTLWGIHNVITHQDTIRGTWNTPYSDLIDCIEQINPEKNYLVISHNPVFNYHARLHGYNVLNVAEGTGWEDMLNKHEGKAIVLRTYKGSMPMTEFEKFNEYIDSKNITFMKSFAPDKFAGLKRRFDKLYPDYYAEILVLE